MWRIVLVAGVIIATAFGSFGIAARQADEAFACVPDPARPDARLHFSVHGGDEPVPDRCLAVQEGAVASQERTVWWYRVAAVLLLGAVGAAVTIRPARRPGVARPS